MRLFLLLFTIICIIEVSQADEESNKVWWRKKWDAEHIANLIKNEYRFNPEFPNSTVEEINDIPETLKEGLLNFLNSEQLPNVNLSFSQTEQGLQTRLYKTFDSEFPSSTVEEVNDTLKTLRKNLWFLNRDYFSNSLLFRRPQDQAWKMEDQRWQRRVYKAKIQELKREREILLAERENLLAEKSYEAKIQELQNERVNLKKGRSCQNTFLPSST